MHKRTCDRCGVDLSTTAYTMSKFNTETICVACKEDERLAPGYAAATEAELRACESGNYNFPGVGLSEADRAFLAEKRASRWIAACAQKSGHHTQGPQ